MPIIYGRLTQKNKYRKEFKFFYINTNGSHGHIQKLAWTNEYNMDALEIMHDLSLEGWECYSVTIEKSLSGFNSVTTYYFKKHIDD